MQKRLKQTNVCHAFSYFVWKETTHKPLKVAVAKSLFSSVYVIGTTCFDECFSFDVITRRHYFSWKFIATLRLSSVPFCCLIWSHCFERSSCFMRYLHINNMMLIPNIQNKADYASSFSNFSYSPSFFFTYEIFLVNDIFIYKLKSSLEAYFLWHNSYISADFKPQFADVLQNRFLKNSQ